MLIDKIFLALVGASGGLLVSAGVFTVLISVGLVPRFAGKTHTGRKIFLYEEAVLLGTLLGNVLSVFGYACRVGEWVRQKQPFGEAVIGLWDAVSAIFVAVFGLFAGIFVGCLALAIAEMLNTIPIFARRIQFRHGLGIAVLSVALGKLCGSLIYFFAQFYLTGV